jgi:hypothetical protein
LRLIKSRSFSAGGDSGSLIVDSATSSPVALLFAGSSTTTIANPVGEVAQDLGVSFVGGGAHAAPCTTKKPRGKEKSESARIFVVMLSGARPGFGRAESKHPYTTKDLCVP